MDTEDPDKEVVAKVANKLEAEQMNARMRKDFKDVADEDAKGKIERAVGVAETDQNMSDMMRGAETRIEQPGEEK